MKTKLAKILMVMLVVLVAVSGLVACGSTGSNEGGNSKVKTITIQDGETVLGTALVKSGDTITIDELKAAAKTEDIVGFYTDEALTQAFVAENEITANMTLYVKIAAKTLYISVNSDGGSKVDKIAVTKGSAYTVPVPEKEGYEFAGYTYLDDDATPTTFATSGTYNYDYNIRLTATWTIKLLTVTFYDGEEEIDSKEVAYGSKVELSTQTKAGYDFVGWKEKDAEENFDATTAITEDIDLYTVFTPHLYTITVEGWHDASIQVYYGATYALADPEDAENELIAAKVGTDSEKEWIAFSGYTYNEEAFPSTGTYNYTKNITVAPVYTPNPSYNKFTVTFWDTIAGSAFGEQKVVPGSFAPIPSASVTEKPGYNFVGWYTTEDATEGTEITSNTEVTASVTVYAIYTAKTFSITVKDTDAEGAVLQTIEVTYLEGYSLNADPEKLGYDFDGYDYANAAFDASGVYVYTDNIVVYAIFSLADSGNFINVSAENYFKERATAEDPYTYVFLVGGTYTFAGYEITSAADGTLININASKDVFTAIAVGDFTFTATSEDGNTVSTINAKNVYDVYAMDVAGSSYDNMIANAKNTNSFQNNVAEADYKMTIGKDNFIPEISIQNAAYADITLEEANVIISANVADFAYTLSGNTINFSQAYAGDVVLTFTPKYASDKSASMTVNMNNGINVYDNAGLKTAYADTSVQTINVLRNITAEFDAANYVDGSGRDVGPVTVTLEDGTTQVVIDNIDRGTPRNWYGGGVYRRTTQNLNDNLVINGNYFTIDGSGLPYVNKVLERDEITEGAGYALGNVQIGIFLYRCASLDADLYDDVVVKWSNGNVTFNNLKIEGNHKTEYSAATINVPNSDLPFVYMSSSLNGIVVRGGTVNLNNSTILKTNIAMFLDGGVSGYYLPGLNHTHTLKDGTQVNTSGVTGQVQDGETQATKANLTDSIIDYSWADSFYSFNLVAIDIKNSKIGRSFGSAIHFDDRPYGGNAENSNGYSNLDSSLKMDMYTAENLNNWVAGTEPWFIAYGLSDQAMLIKTQMEQGAGSQGMTILDERDAGQFMNFAIVVNQTAKNDTAAWSADNRGGIYLATSQAEIQAINAAADVVFFYGDTDEIDLTAYLTAQANQTEYEPAANGMPDDREWIGYYTQVANTPASADPFICAKTGTNNVYIRAYAAGN